MHVNRDGINFSQIPNHTLQLWLESNADVFVAHYFGDNNFYAIVFLISDIKYSLLSKGARFIKKLTDTCN